tara:strand:- start:167 stop:1261 length:1095 start_codon:yes stop_codon:yes gene_type:complete
MNIGILFSYGISLKDWDQSGLIDREIEIYKKLSKYHKITFITFGTNDDLKFKSKLKSFKIVPVYKFIKKRNKYLNFLISFFIPILLKTHFKEIDILKCNQMWGSWIAVINKIIYKKNYILRCGYEMYQNELHGNNFIRKRLFFFISYFSYIFSKKIVVTTKDIKKFIVKHFYINSKKIIIIPNFINTAKFKSLSKKKTNDCLFIGRLSEEKNLFKIFGFLSGTKKRLFIIGDGKIKKRLIEYKKNLKINVSFLKNIKNNNLPRIYNRFKFFILMSKFEGNPKVLLEAMACGCICLVNKSQGIKGIIKNNYNGFFIKNKFDFINIIKKIENNKSIYLKISKNSQNFIKKNNSLEIITKEELKLYK